MRFLQSFLEEAERRNTTPKEVPKVPEAHPASANTTLEEVPKAPETAFVTSGTPGTLVYRRESDAGKDGVLRTFPGSKVIQLPRRCEHCSKSKELEGAPAWRRHGKIVQRVWLDGQAEWCCHCCGRKAINEKAGKQISKEIVAGRLVYKN